MITLEILCWENDYRHILSSSYLNKLSQSLGSEFSCKKLLVNQVISRSNVKRLLSKVSDFFDEITFVEDYFLDSLDYLNVEASFTPRELQYSRGQFVGLAQCETRYLFHLNADAEILNESKIPFLKHGVEVLQNCDDILAFSPMWAFQSSSGVMSGQDGYLLETAKKIPLKNRNYAACKGFSDNCFLVDAARLRSIDWNTQSDKTHHFPKYAGLSFEKRIANYIINNDLYRAIDPSVTQINIFLPRNLSSRILQIYNNLIWNNLPEINTAPD